MQLGVEFVLWFGRCCCDQEVSGFQNDGSKSQTPAPSDHKNQTSSQGSDDRRNSLASAVWRYDT